MAKSDKLRDQAEPTVLGHRLDRVTLAPMPGHIHLHDREHGADPLGGGMFRMVPSGDIVDFGERQRRLARYGS